MKKAAIICDYTFEEWGYGGAEQSARWICDEAANYDFDCVEISKNKYRFGALRDIDVLILTNIGRYDALQIEEMTSGFPFVKSEYDYGYCKGRAAMCADGCKSCVEDGKYREMLEKALFTHFVSPQQKRAYKAVLGDVVHNSIVYPPYVNYEEFFDMEIPRIPGLLVTHGRQKPLKGLQNVLSYITTVEGKVRLLVVGEGPQQAFTERVTNAIDVGQIDTEALNTLLNLAEAWILMPDWVDTGPTTVIEAILAGCQILHNGRLGILEYPWLQPPYDRETIIGELEKTPRKIWEQIGEEL